MPQATDVQQGDIDFAGFRAFGPRGPVTAEDIARYGDLSLGIASSAALSALSITSGMDTGLPKWVATRRRLFMLDKTAAAATLAAEPGNVIVAADGVSRWLAMPTPDAYWNSRTSWLVRPVAGDDEASTASVKTLRELNRRLYGSLYDFQTVITVDADVPLSDATVLHNVRSVNGLGFPTMVGKKTQIGSDYVVSAFTPADADASGGGTGYIVQATGIGDPGNVGQLLETTDGIIGAWVQSSIDANHVRVNTPSNGDPLVGDPGVYSSLAGKTVRIFSLSRLPVYPFGPLAGFNALAWCRFGFGYASPNFHFGQIGAASPYISRCKSEGANLNGGLNGGWNCTMWSANGAIPTALCGHEAFVNYCAVGGGGIGLSLQSKTLLLCQGQGDEREVLDVEATGIQMEFSTLGAGIWSLSAFNCTVPVIRISPAGEVQQFPGRMYGRGNTSYLISAPSGAKVQVNAAGINFGTTKPKIALIAGVERDLPFSGLRTAANAVQGTT